MGLVGEWLSFLEIFPSVFSFFCPSSNSINSSSDKEVQAMKRLYKRNFFISKFLVHFRSLTFEHHNTDY